MFKLLFVIPCVLIGIGVYGLWDYNTTKELTESDLIYIETTLDDDPEYVTRRGKNSKSYIDIYVSSFSGQSFKTPPNFFDSGNEYAVLNKLKSRDSITIALLREDYRLLKSKNRDWSVTGGFSTSRRLRNISLYQLKKGDQDFIYWEDVVNDNSSNRGFGFWVSVILLILGVIILNALIKAKKEMNAKKKSPVQ